eukprot:m.100763 g.100763  ORF g.100763 m.100763 type:complete len:1975 (+) comp22253_c0_seq1:217-6141(+)
MKRRIKTPIRSFTKPTKLCSKKQHYQKKIYRGTRVKTRLHFFQIPNTTHTHTFTHSHTHSLFLPLSPFLSPSSLSLSRCPPLPSSPLQDMHPPSRFLLCIAGFLLQFQSSSAIRISGSSQTFHDVTLELQSRKTYSETDNNPNPFHDIHMGCRFQLRVQNKAHDVKVHGYFAADGRAADTSAKSGKTWRCHFSPPAAGRWSYSISFRQASGIAVLPFSQATTRGTTLDFHGEKGFLPITATTKTRPDFRAEGPLLYNGSPYLQFLGSNRRFLKGGAGSPENFLAYHEFDDTPPSHKYEPHLQDYDSRTAASYTWKNGKGKAIFGALKYLAGKKVNSVYFLTMNIKGDGDDVWPYVSDKPKDYRHFDCSKLDQWNRVFSYMQSLGICLHVIQQETENDHLLNNGDLGTERKLYYKELIARFSHHSCVIWNLGEENTNTGSQAKSFSQYIKFMDPYEHPIAIHTNTNPAKKQLVYTPLLGWPFHDIASLQLGNYDHRQISELNEWLKKSAAAGRPWVASIDEAGSARLGVVPDSEDSHHDGPRMWTLWSGFFEGSAGVAWYFGWGFPNSDLTCEDFRTRDRMWDLTRYALEFVQTLPFWEMSECSGFVEGKFDGVCKAKNQKAYALYLRETPRSINVDVKQLKGQWTLKWFHPRNGKYYDSQQLNLNNKNQLSISRPTSDDGDWAISLLPTDGGGDGGDDHEDDEEELDIPKPDFKCPARQRSRRAPAKDDIRVSVVHSDFGGISDEPTDMAFVGEEYLLVSVRTGKIWILDLHHGYENAPRSLYHDLTTDVDSSNRETGLLSIAMDPEFPSQSYFYVYYASIAKDGMVVAKYRYQGPTTRPAFVQYVWHDDEGFTGRAHYGGQITFDNKNNLLLITGDKLSARAAQDLKRVGGKLIRVSRQGIAPADNWGRSQRGARPDIVAYGLRNPYRVYFDSVTNKAFIAEVGGNDDRIATEDIHVWDPSNANQRLNYGWPWCQGSCSRPGTTFSKCNCQEHDDPLYYYDHEGKGKCIIGGFVYRGDMFPSLKNQYIFADLIEETVRYLQFKTSSLDQVKSTGIFLDSAGAVQDLKQAPDGSILVIVAPFYQDKRELEVREIRRISSASSKPTANKAVLEITSFQVEQGTKKGKLPAAFWFHACVFDSENGALFFDWSFGDGQTEIGTRSASIFHVYEKAGQYRAQVKVLSRASRKTVTSRRLIINVGAAPEAKILRPQNGLVFDGGDRIPFAGTLNHPGSNFRLKDYHWTIRLIHDEHSHLEYEARGADGVFEVPTDGHPIGPGLGFLITLEGTVPGTELSTITSVSLVPNLVSITVDVQPASTGLLLLDELPVSTPTVQQTLNKFSHLVEVVPLTSEYNFIGWSDGVKSASRTLVAREGVNVVAYFEKQGEEPPSRTQRPPVPESNSKGVVTFVRISEIMPSPPLKQPGESIGNHELLEYMEVGNTGSKNLNIGGLEIAGDVKYTFPDDTLLQAGHVAVLARSASDFAERYPNVAIAGEYKGTLRNRGDRLQLLYQGTIIMDFAHLASSRHSLELVNLASGGSDSDNDWQKSECKLGSPGKAFCNKQFYDREDPPDASVSPTSKVQPTAASTSASAIDPSSPASTNNEELVLRHVFVSEVMHSPPRKQQGEKLGASHEFYEFIEVGNTASQSLEVGGLSISVDIEFTFPANTFIAPGGVLTVVRSTQKFPERYPDVNIAGEYSGTLKNKGNRLVLTYRGKTLMDFFFKPSKPWPENSSMKLVKLDSDGSRAEDWISSACPLGSPGRASCTQDRFGTNNPPPKTNVPTKPQPPSNAPSKPPTDNEVHDVLSFIRITEVCYAPPPKQPSERLSISSHELLEYIEVGNIGSPLGSEIDIGGLTISNGIEYTFPAGSTLKSGEVTVLVRRSSAFALRYPDVKIGGSYKGVLNNRKDKLTLTYQSKTIMDVEYHNSKPWPIKGILQLTSLVSDGSAASDWSNSACVLGSPGRATCDLLVFPPLDP